LWINHRRFAALERFGHCGHLTAAPTSKQRAAAEIWRYPVKSTGGEQLDDVEIGEEGIPGDRVIHVEDARGRVVTSRSHPLLHRATLGPDGQPRVDGRAWNDPDVGRDVEAAAGPGIVVQGGRHAVLTWASRTGGIGHDDGPRTHCGSIACCAEFARASGSVRFLSRRRPPSVGPIHCSSTNAHRAPRLHESERDA
jgi:hypothetical protein